jgi:hypothetical protein
VNHLLLFGNVKEPHLDAKGSSIQKICSVPYGYGELLVNWFILHGCSTASIWRGPLTFDPSPPLDEDEDAPLAAADVQAELMRWHYRLGHLPFPKLKQLARNGEILKKLAKLTAPECAGCLFGAMTKLPWRGKGSKSSHKVFTATKPGETVSVVCRSNDFN